MDPPAGNAFAPAKPSPSEMTFFEVPGEVWIPVLQHECTFSRSIFYEVMLNLIRNPNVSSNLLFRADIIEDSAEDSLSISAESLHGKLEDYTGLSRASSILGFEHERTLVRKLIPRNPQLDKSLLQSCHIYHANEADGDELTMVVYVPHVSGAEDMPYYHPDVRSLAFLHRWTRETNASTISIHYRLFDGKPSMDDRLERTAYHLLSTIYKHGHGNAAGYIKRVHHDQLVPQKRLQDTYSRLKAVHAKRLISSWVEQTNPSKHVFEDLGIAAFLIELWRDMYSKEEPLPGFVDIGCGNGVLVDILIREGYGGWGFDARRRKTWQTFSLLVQSNLKERVLVPGFLAGATEDSLYIRSEFEDQDIVRWHDGVFPIGTFIISNHADELTPWTPLLASLSSSPFLIIPCCSHNLSGARFRASAHRNSSSAQVLSSSGNVRASGKQPSAYASLVAWVERLAKDCGYEVEKEMLRIPSTRNTALVARRRIHSTQSVEELLRLEGGGEGWVERAVALTKAKARAH
ncbi:MAG: tRNA(Ser) Um(44) 2'-O-methyltransferase [Pycnora praestabilis]|nr:MAG: tRNA(Ser) Um(44) 2'-O-methyltransferase [Pycnora praestabilis]